VLGAEEMIEGKEIEAPAAGLSNHQFRPRLLIQREKKKEKIWEGKGDRMISHIFGAVNKEMNEKPLV